VERVKLVSSCDSLIVKSGVVKFRRYWMKLLAQFIGYLMHLFILLTISISGPKCYYKGKLKCRNAER
jgi:hypothetical protein